MVVNVQSGFAEAGSAETTSTRTFLRDHNQTSRTNRLRRGAQLVIHALKKKDEYGNRVESSDLLHRS